MAKRADPEKQKAAQEEKRRKFKDLATKRVNKALDVLTSIGRLANRQNYFYAEADGQRIVGALNEKLGEVAQAFEGKAEIQEGFTLD